MAIEVKEERHGPVVVLSPVGRLDSGSARSFESVIMQCVRRGERRMVIDFDRLDFISSAGLRALLVAAKALAADDGELVLCAMKSHIEEVLRTSGFDHLLPIKDSREAALAASSRPDNDL